MSEFKALPPNLQRVAVAKDALEQITHQTVSPSRGGFVLNLRVPRPFIGRELQEFLLTGDASCQACALGTIFLSTVRLADEYEWTEKDWNADGISCYRPERMFQRLLAVFSNAQIQLIECAFECGRGWFSFSGKGERELVTSVEERERAKSFGLQFSHDSDRMVAILNNIIENNGEFILPEFQIPANI